MDTNNKQITRDKILNADDLPTLPVIVGRILELVDNPKTTAGTLSDLINVDPVMATKVLKVSNSAFFGFPRKISTLNLAIVVLGFSSLKHLCLSVGVMSMWPQENDTGFDMKAFWVHSISTGVAARLLARKINYEIPGEAFVVGLIHDIGKLLLNVLAEEEYEAVLKESQSGKKGMHEVEQEILGVDHSEVGGWLTEKWNLPPELVQSIAAHHSEDRIKDNQLNFIVKVANSLSHHAKVGRSGNYKQYDFEEDVIELYAHSGKNLSEEGIVEILMEFEEEIVKSEAFFSLN